MAFPSKPADKARWTVLDDATDTENDLVDGVSGQLNVDEPSEGKKDTGFLFKEFPPRQDFNWLFRKIYQWLRWTEDSVDELKLSIPDYYKSGLTLRNAADADHDITVLQGIAIDKTNTVPIRLGSLITKQIDTTWVAGNNAGGLASGVSLTNNTWYHVFVILDESTGTVDVGFDTSITAANLIADSGYDKYRRIGSVLTDGSANIIPFYQTANFFRWDSVKTAYSNDFGSSGSVGLQNIDLDFIPPSVETECMITGVQGNPVTGSQYFGVSDRRVSGIVSVSDLGDVGFYADTTNRRYNGDTLITLNGEAQIDTEGSANGWGVIELYTSGYRELFNS